MNKVALALAAAALALSTGSALAQKKQLVIVVKGLDNPFFEAIHQGNGVRARPADDFCLQARENRILYRA